MFASDNLADAAALAETEGLCNLILIRLKPFHSPKALAEMVRTISPDDDSARLITREDLLRQLRSDAIQSLSRQVPLLVILACVATLCMIVNALCVGIEQNRHRYARLRALGMTARQLVALILREGAFIASVGGAVGFLMGWSILALFVAQRPLLLPDGLHLGWATPMGVVGLLTLSACMAFIIPVRRVRQLSPCEFRLQTESTVMESQLKPFLLSIALLLPIVLTPFIFHAQPLWRSAYFLLIGLPLTIWGLLRIVRPLLWFCETCFALPVGKVMGLRPELLHGCLTRFADRNARMVMMLSTGLGAFFAIHLWGASLTDPFIPSRELPDAVVSLLPNGLSAEGAADLARTPVLGVTLTPFTAEQYCLQDDDFNAITTRTGATPKQNNILLLGSPGETGVTVTAMFARQCGLTVGDTFHIQRKNRAGKIFTLPLTITHIRAINWHLFTARARLRARNGAPMGTLGPVFVSADLFKAWDAEACARTCFLWADLPAEAPREDQALYSFSDRLELSLQAVADQDAAMRPYYTSRLNQKPGPNQKPVAPANVVVHLRDEISTGTLARSSELLADLARIPLWSLMILCTGFISLLAANVRVMGDELRTLHAIGMTRCQMVRLLFAQTLLLTFVAIFTALLFAFTAGWGFTGWTLAWMPFGGLPIAIAIPWGPFMTGTMVLLIATFILTPLPIALLLRQLLRR
jgi:putative ABC transport system permease protein